MTILFVLITVSSYPQIVINGKEWIRPIDTLRFINGVCTPTYSIHKITFMDSIFEDTKSRLRNLYRTTFIGMSPETLKWIGMFDEYSIYPLFDSIELPKRHCNLDSL